MKARTKENLTICAILTTLIALLFVVAKLLPDRIFYDVACYDKGVELHRAKDAYINKYGVVFERYGGSYTPPGGASCIYENPRN